MKSSCLTLIESAFDDSIHVKQASQERLAPAIEAAVDLLASALKQGKKALSCGNGGSASDAIHFSSELINRFRLERAALAAIAACRPAGP